MKHLVFFFTLVFCTSAYAQKLPTIFKAGFYSGGICLDNAVCGDWVLKPDSSFVFIEFDKSCIKKMEVGDITTVTDSFITVKFNKRVPALSFSKINYLSETKQSFDSVYLFGQLNNMLDQPIQYATIVYGGKRSTVSDGKGAFSAVFPLKDEIQQIEIIKRDEHYLPVSFQLNPNNNYHKFVINIPKVDSDACITDQSTMLENATYTFRIINDRTKKKGSLSLVYISNDEQPMIHKLQEAKSKQPFLSSNIEMLIGYIRK